MSELFLMKIITGLCIVTILLIYVFPRLNIRLNLKQYRFKENSFKGFSSFNEFFNYFRFAFNFTLKNKFVFLFPFVFVISLNLISTVMLYIFRISYKDIIVDNENPFTLYKYVNINYLINSLKELDYGFYDFAFFNYLGLIISITIFGVIYFLFYKTTKKISGIYNKKITISLILYFILLFTTTTILLLIDAERIQLSKFVSAVLSIIIFIYLCFDYLSLFLMQSVFELTILVFVTSKLMNKDLNLNIYKEYLKYIKPLLYLNSFLGLVLILESSTWNIGTIFQFIRNINMDIINHFLDYVYPVLDILQYVWIFLFIVLFPSPLILVFNKLNFTSTIQYTLKFVLDNLVKHLIFIICGIMLMYISSLLYVIPYNLVDRLSHFQPILMILSGCIKLFLAVIFYIAFFKFYIDSQKQSDQDAIV